MARFGLDGTVVSTGHDQSTIALGEAIRRKAIQDQAEAAELIGDDDIQDELRTYHQHVRGVLDDEIRSSTDIIAIEALQKFREAIYGLRLPSEDTLVEDRLLQDHKLILKKKAWEK